MIYLLIIVAALAQLGQGADSNLFPEPWDIDNHFELQLKNLTHLINNKTIEAEDRLDELKNYYQRITDSVGSKGYERITSITNEGIKKINEIENQNCKSGQRRILHLQNQTGYSIYVSIATIQKQISGVKLRALKKLIQSKRIIFIYSDWFYSCQDYNCKLDVLMQKDYVLSYAENEISEDGSLSNSEMFLILTNYEMETVPSVLSRLSEKVKEVVNEAIKCADQ